MKAEHEASKWCEEQLAAAERELPSLLCPFMATEDEHEAGACPCYPGRILEPGEQA